MGVASSFLERHCHIIELMHTIHKNDIKTLKRKIKYAETTDAMLLFLEAIRRERKQFFDFLLEKLNILSEDLCDHIESGYYEQCFSASVNCSDPYYATKLLEVYDFIPIHKRSALLHIAVHVENEFIAHQLILKGTDINAFDIIGQTPLDDAIKCNNMDLVCMLLYYGAYTNHLPDNLTSFMYSIICQCTEDIQRVLIDYEADFNLTCNGTSTLFFAIKYKSPVTLDIIEHGADVSYYDGIHNSVSLAMLYDCDSSVFKVIWDKFDYKVWTISYSKSVLIKFLQTDTIITEWVEYLKIFIENETKLRLDLEHHNNSYFYKSDPIISIFYLRCLEKDVDKGIIESFVFHLLSHGAHIFEKDIDVIYRKLGVITPFLESLLYMDLQSSSHDSYSIMYFRYTPVPNVNIFLMNTIFPSDALLSCLKYLRRFYAFDSDLKMQILDILGSEEINYEACKKVLDESVTFPSLLQLSRDSARRSICLKYVVNNSCKLYTIIKHLYLPKYIENILFFDICLYYFPT
ncbi:uncharacterized protein LOC108911311 [Anoplophora glabripennis]|uniref:uncharacterized protein LOC108911311 n=1 Tax=Anoplophora glabripennis TaxID=217634 RepID=UPI00087520D1|nr:uncharacterized protein LOC108911311 [Anoplophora glabripennis]